MYHLSSYYTRTLTVQLEEAVPAVTTSYIYTYTCPITLRSTKLVYAYYLLHHSNQSEIPAQNSAVRVWFGIN